MAELSKQLVDAMKQSAESKTSAFDSIGTVRRVKDGVAYVHLAGGVDETPVQLTVDAKAGDEVQVRVSGGRAWIVGNATAPPTDNTMAKQAINYSKIANDAAQRATKDALVANEAAQSASASAREAKETTDEINAYADTAGKTITQILNDGETAGTAAQQAKTAADTAFTNLSQIQSVLEVAEWIATHGTYAKATTFNPNVTYYTITATQVTSPSDDDKDSQGVLIYYEESGGIYTRTADTEVDPLKTYYNISGTPVAGAKAEDISQYYTLAVSDAMADYIQSHLALTDEGLWLVKDGSGYKFKLTNYGSYIVAPDGTTIVNQNTADGNIIRALDGTVIAHLGYGEGQAEISGTAEAPYYTLGTRMEATNIWDSTRTYTLGSLVLWGTPLEAYVCIKENITGISPANDDYWKLCVGNYSCAEGHLVVASGYASHAEGGYGTTASGNVSHAEGNNTRAIGQGSHAEGISSVASGVSSHAEGTSAKATAHASHAQNLYTEANYEAQTAIGKYNDNQSNNAFEIGNGADIGARSNAFTVDWNGNTTADGDIEDGQGNVLANKADTSSLATVATSGDYDDLSNKPTIPAVPDNYIVEEGTTNGWSYRKWSNGEVEAWYNYSGSAGTFTTWVSPIRYKEVTVSIPSGIFTASPKIFPVSRTNQFWVVHALPSSATSFTVRLATVASSSLTPSFRVYATSY